MADVEQAGPVIRASAGAAVTAFLAGVIVAGEAIHADNTNADHAGRLRGIFRASKADGETAQLQVFGPMLNPAWTWTPDLPIYVGSAGSLTQTPPPAGWLQQIAVADTATQIFINPQPLDDREERLSLPFAWGDATPSQAGIVPANKLIKRVELHITAAFDGSSPALRVAFSGSLEALLAETQNDPAAVGTYQTHPNASYGADKTILLSITPGSGASAGAGLLVVTFQR